LGVYTNRKRGEERDSRADGVKGDSLPIATERLANSNRVPSSLFVPTCFVKYVSRLCAQLSLHLPKTPVARSRQLTTMIYKNKKASIRWQDSAPPISGGA